MEAGAAVTGITVAGDPTPMAATTSATLGLKLHALLQDINEFDFGRERRDLIAGLYTHGMISQNAARLREALNRGGAAPGADCPAPGAEARRGRIVDRALAVVVAGGLWASLSFSPISRWWTSTSAKGTTLR